MCAFFLLCFFRAQKTMSLSFPCCAFVPSDNEGSGPEASEALSKLLKLDASKFRSTLTSNKQLRSFIDSYLAYRRRPYDEEASSGKQLRKLDLRVLFVVARGAEEGVLVDASRLLALAALHSETNNKDVVKNLAIKSDAGEVRRCFERTTESLTEAKAHGKDGLLYARDAALSVAALAAVASNLVATTVTGAFLGALSDFDDAIIDEAVGRIAVASDMEAVIEWLAESAPRSPDAVARALTKTKHVLSRALENHEPSDESLFAYARQALDDAISEDETPQRRDGVTIDEEKQPEKATSGGEDLLTQQVAAVKAVLGPDAFGDGYVAAWLAVLNYDVATVVGRLLENDPPSELRHLDPKLDSIHTKEAAVRIEADPAFERRQKQRLRAFERAEQDALRIRDNLYDDDYDDRYDDAMEPTVSGLGDQDTIRKFNALRKADDAEDAYWQQNKNTNRENDNRPSILSSSSAPSPPKKKHDLTKPIPKKPLDPAAAKKAKEDLQKARKRADKHKSAVANHHRRDRAAKKTGTFPVA